MTAFNKIFLFFKPLAVIKQLSLPSKSGEIEELEIFPNDSMKEKIQNIWEKMTLHWKDPFRDKVGSHQNFGTHTSFETKRATKMDLEKKESRGLRGIFFFFFFELSWVYRERVIRSLEGSLKFRPQSREHNLISGNIVQREPGGHSLPCLLREQLITFRVAERTDTRWIR